MEIRVAAVCYRVVAGEVQFLLVRTKGGRLTVPKGRRESQLSDAESAAKEALEEAGASGDIDPMPFTSFLNIGRDKNGIERVEQFVYGFLMRVTDEQPPHESWRDPHWYPLAQATALVAHNRGPRSASEFQALLRAAQERIMVAVA